MDPGLSGPVGRMNCTAVDDPTTVQNLSCLNRFVDTKSCTYFPVLSGERNLSWNFQKGVSLVQMSLQQIQPPKVLVELIPREINSAPSSSAFKLTWEASSTTPSVCRGSTILGRTPSTPKQSWPTAGSTTQSVCQCFQLIFHSIGFMLAMQVDVTPLSPETSCSLLMQARPPRRVLI